MEEKMYDFIAQVVDEEHNRLRNVMLREVSLADAVDQVSKEVGPRLYSVAFASANQFKLYREELR